MLPLHRMQKLCHAFCPEICKHWNKQRSLSDTPTNGPAPNAISVMALGAGLLVHVADRYFSSKVNWEPFTGGANITYAVSSTKVKHTGPHSSVRPRQTLSGRQREERRPPRHHIHVRVRRRVAPPALRAEVVPAGRHHLHAVLPGHQPFERVVASGVWATSLLTSSTFDS